MGTVTWSVWQLSITEYRKRHKGGCVEEGGGGSSSEAGEAGSGGEAGEAAPEWSSESSGAASLSPQRLDAAAQAAADELEQRLHRELAADHMPKGQSHAQTHYSFYSGDTIIDIAKKKKYRRRPLTPYQLNWYFYLFVFYWT